MDILTIPNPVPLNSIQLIAFPMSNSQQVCLAQETKRLADLKAAKDKSEERLKNKFRDDSSPITKFNYRVHKTTKIATMRITRNNQPLNYKIFDDFKFKMLWFTEWMELHRNLYDLASTPQLIRIQNLIKIDSVFSQEKYDELIWIIEFRHDIEEARNIIEKNLDGLGMD
ncbi:hypothetical protein Tco_1492454 [Tanacetum coccineum]